MCVCNASRQDSHYRMAVIEILALTFFVTCQYSVARGTGINASVVTFKVSRDPEEPSLLHHNGRLTRLNDAGFKFLSNSSAFL